MQKKRNAIISMVILGDIVMAIVDGVVQPEYAIKSLIKIFVFLILPLFHCIFTKETKLFQILKPRKSSLLISLGLGFFVFGVVFVSYLITRQFFDYSTVLDKMASGQKVTRDNIIPVTTYIAFCNSLLEEFFFRGFSFLILSQYTSRKFAFIFSSFTFAIYHVAMMGSWFSQILFILAMFGLAAGGCIFDWIDEKTTSIYNSWFIHMFANFAINLIGFILFGIVNI